MTVRKQIRFAEQLVSEGFFEQAKDLLIDLLEKDSKNPEVYYVLGDVLSKLLRFDEAILLLQKACQLYPEHPLIHQALGWAFFMNGDLNTGRKWLLQALAGNPDDERVYTDLAALELKAQRLEKATRYVKQGLRIAPTDVFLLELSHLLHEMIRSKNQVN